MRLHVQRLNSMNNMHPFVTELTIALPAETKHSVKTETERTEKHRGRGSRQMPCILLFFCELDNKATNNGVTEEEKQF